MQFKLLVRSEKTQIADHYMIASGRPTQSVKETLLSGVHWPGCVAIVIFAASTLPSGHTHLMFSVFGHCHGNICDFFLS